MSLGAVIIWFLVLVLGLIGLHKLGRPHLGVTGYQVAMAAFVVIMVAWALFAFGLVHW
jgi:hypothetical protein